MLLSLFRLYLDPVAHCFSIDLNHAFLSTVQPKEVTLTKEQKSSTTENRIESLHHWTARRYHR